MVQESGVHGFPDRVVAAEGKRQVADATAGLCQWQVLLDPLYGTNEVDAVGSMFADTRSHRQDVNVEDDVLRWKSYGGQQPVSPFSNGNLARVSGRLSLFVERHHDDGSTQPPQFACLPDERSLALLQADGVDDALSRRVLQPFHHRLPV